jgi:hypothetical protein
MDVEFEEGGAGELEKTADAAEERGDKMVWYCPLYSIAFGVLYPCLREKCMWYDADEDVCILESLKHVIWRAAGEIAGP